MAKILSKFDDIEIVDGDNGKKYIVFVNSKNKNFKISVNYNDYTKYGLSGFDFTPKTVNGATVFDNVKYVKGNNGDDYVVFKNKKAPNYTISVNEKDLKSNGYTLNGFNFRTGIPEKKVVNECFDY